MITITIPQDRVPVLIGRSGKTKEFIEKKTGTKITVGQEIIISGDPEMELKCSDIAKAIGRGFHPNRATRLLLEGTVLDVITIKGNFNTIKRVAARIIGSQGKARKNIEKLTGAAIAVYGKTVSIIGSQKEASNAREAVELIILGRKHGSVWKHLENNRE